VRSPHFTSLLVCITEACRVGCAHCGLIGSAREREIDAAELRDWVQQACSYGIPSIIFTGGEPFDRPELLRQGVLTASRASVPSAVFTSSVWATSVETAVATLRPLEGLHHLYLSSDAYHQQRVPYASVHHVIVAADTLQIPEITICITYASDADLRSVRSHYERYGQRVRLYESRVIPTPFIHPSLRDQDPLPEPSRENLESSCWLGTPFIQPNGDLFGCHAGAVGTHGDQRSLPYWLGNLREDSLQTILQAASDEPGYQYLRTHGPRGIAWLLEEFPGLPTAVGREAFTGPCDLCFAVLSTPQGQQCLAEYAHRPETVESTNIRLAFVLGEPPMGTVDDTSASR
jgi:hypothetical protein